MPKRKRIPIPPPSVQREAMRQVVADTVDGDLFGGCGHFDPSGYVAIARAITVLEPKSKRPKATSTKPKTVKRAPKKKKTPPPKKGKPVAKATEVLIQSPYDKFPQRIPLVASLRELLDEGWRFVDGGDVPANEAYEFLKSNLKELQSA